jgi:hypothetical protein
VRSRRACYLGAPPLNRPLGANQVEALSSRILGARRKRLFGSRRLSFSPGDGAVHFICRSAPEFAVMATHFGGFLAEFERRDFRLQEWTDSLNAQPYDWGA